MLHCAYDHPGVIVSIHVASDIGYLVYATRIRMLDVLRGFSSSRYEHVGMSRIHRHETLLVHHSTPNAKLYQIFAMKIGHPHCRILTSKAC